MYTARAHVVLVLFFQVVSGHIGPFCTVHLEVVFAPIKPGNALADFELSFEDPLSEPVSTSSLQLFLCCFDRIHHIA